MVDDNHDAAESLAILLKLSGHDTYIAHDGLEAVDRAAQLSPDIVLLDIGLPKSNGFEAARRIREQSQGKRLLLVALTGWGQDADRQKAREARFNAHIVKPVDAAVLANLLVEFPWLALSADRGSHYLREGAPSFPRGPSDRKATPPISPARLRAMP